MACCSSFRVLHKGADSVGPAFCAFSGRAAQAARSLTRALSPRAVHLIPSAVPASVSTRASRVHAPCVSSGKLASRRDPPGGCQPSRISGSLWLETEPVCSLVGVPSLGVSLPLSPPPCLLPPVGKALVRSRLALLWDRSVLRLFCEGAHSVFWPVNFFSLSLAVPQFKLLSRVSSLRLPSGHSGPVLTLSNAAGSSLCSPHLLVVDVGILGTFFAGSCF